MSHPTRQRGITLIEIILWSAIVAAAAVALFVFAGRARVAAAVETEQRQVEQLVRTVDGLFQLQPNFAALGTNGAAYLDLRGAERSGLKFTRTEHGVLTLATGVGSGELNLAVWDVESTSSAPDDFDVFFHNASNGHWVGEVGYGQVYAHNSPPADVRGERCSWTKFEFMNN